MRAEPGVCHFSPILQLTRQLWRSVAREIFYQPIHYANPGNSRLQYLAQDE